MADDQKLTIEPVEFKRADGAAKQPLLTLNPVTLSIGLVFLMLATAALFMFNARAVRFIIEPEAQVFDLTSGMPTYQLGERYLMLPGEYEIKALHDGYYPLQTGIAVTSDPEQDFSFELTKLPGILEVSAGDVAGEISGAEVFIDQELVGLTPLRLEEVDAGARDLYVVHPRYRPWQTEIQIEGMRVVQHEAIILEPAWADVTVRSLPEGADILVGDTLLDTTPAVIELLEGNRQLRLKKPGYKVWETEVTVAAGENQVLPEALLIKSDGMLNISTSPSGANITIAGQYYGQSPLSISLAPGEGYKMLVTRAGYQSINRDLDIEPEEDLTLNMRLKPVVGLVRLSVAPEGATLLVDGVAAGQPNRTLELPARAHELKVELAGYAPFVTSIIPQPGFPQQLNVTLQTEEEARVSAIPQRVQTALGDTLRFIIPGELTMGAGRREPGRRSNEIEKQVALTRAFYLGEHEISNRSYKTFRPGHDSGLLGRALLSEDDRPVVNVSWSDAVQFCNWLSDRDGLPAAYEQANGNWQLKQPVNTGYRLPTEAEWAWAARYADNYLEGASGNSVSRFPWGDSMPPPPRSGNFADVSALNMAPYSIRDYNDNFRGPAPSGTYPGNSLGLFDLAGNVSEWMTDHYSIEIPRETLMDPTGPGSGEYHVIRGSNYTHGRFSELRWTWRDYGTDPRPDVGFRLARYAE
jgi:formylglycine-generating enzyme required for sulfatase activity